MKYTENEIEGIENLCRFLCDHQDVLHKHIMKTSNLIYKKEYEEAKDLLIMNTPIIQGSKNQLDLADIGKQGTDMKKIRDGVNAMLKGDK